MSEEIRESDGTSGRDESAGPVDDLSLDTIYTLLSHHHRRAVIDLLSTHDRALTLRDLRNEIVEEEHGTDITEVPQERAEQTLLSLYHDHVPKLVEEGVVNYDHDRGVVEPTEMVSRLESFLPQS